MELLLDLDLSLMSEKRISFILQKLQEHSKQFDLYPAEYNILVSNFSEEFSKELLPGEILAYEPVDESSIHSSLERVKTKRMLKKTCICKRREARPAETPALRPENISANCRTNMTREYKTIHLNGTEGLLKKKTRGMLIRKKRLKQSRIGGSSCRAI